MIYTIKFEPGKITTDKNQVPDNCEVYEVGKKYYPRFRSYFLLKKEKKTVLVGFRENCSWASSRQEAIEMLRDFLKTRQQ